MLFIYFITYIHLYQIIDVTIPEDGRARAKEDLASEVRRMRALRTRVIISLNGEE